MRAVVQRASEASVSVGGKTVGSIGPGMVVLLGVGEEDTAGDADFLADKTANLRIFADIAGKMNLSLLDTGGEALVISQFTLYGDCRKGRRPNFTGAAGPVKAEKYYRQYVDSLRAKGVKVEIGTFQAHMAVNLVNDGPVTMLLDSKRNF